jgi:hypothetical protein
VGEVESKGVDSVVIYDHQSVLLPSSRILAHTRGQTKGEKCYSFDVRRVRLQERRGFGVLLSFRAGCHIENKSGRRCSRCHTRGRSERQRRRCRQGGVPR